MEDREKEVAAAIAESAGRTANADVREIYRAVSGLGIEEQDFLSAVIGFDWKRENPECSNMCLWS